MWRTTVTLLASVALGACIAFPPWHKELNRAENYIEVGETTKAHVIEILGEPEWEGPKDGSLYYSGKTPGGVWCEITIISVLYITPPIPAPDCGVGPEEAWWIEIALDDNGVVMSVATKASSGRPARMTSSTAICLRANGPHSDAASCLVSVIAAS